eukprot:763340-Hanusia_phi.AAC.16
MRAILVLLGVLLVKILQLDRAGTFTQTFKPAVLNVNSARTPHQECDGCPRMSVVRVRAQHCLQDFVANAREVVHCDVDVDLEIQHDVHAYPNVSIFGSIDGLSGGTAKCSRKSCKFNSRRLILTR